MLVKLVSAQIMCCARQKYMTVLLSVVKMQLNVTMARSVSLINSYKCCMSLIVSTIFVLKIHNAKF